MVLTSQREKFFNRLNTTVSRNHRTDRWGALDFVRSRTEHAKMQLYVVPSKRRSSLLRTFATIVVQGVSPKFSGMSSVLK